MNYKKIFVTGLVTVGAFISGCAYASEIEIPNLGIFKMKTWESVANDPDYGGGYINTYILHDKEKDKDYIVVKTHDAISITERK